MMRFSSEIKESPTLKLGEIARARKAQGKKVISLALGEPDFKTPDFIIEATKKALDEGYTGYSTSQGLIELREAISKDFKDRYNANYTSDEIIIFPGAKAAIFGAMASILEPNDEVIIISPYYVSYPAIIKLAEFESKIIDIELNHDFTIPIDKIKAAINENTKCLILNFPNNPTGQLISHKDALAIKKLVLDNDIYLLSDEIYDKMVFSNDKYISFSSFEDLKNNLILVNGFSKTYAMTGFRVGYILTNKKLMRKISILNQNINTNTNTFVQRGILSIYDNDDKHINDYNKELKARVDYIHKEINKIPFLSGIKPKGGFYYYVDISKTKMDSMDFSNYLIDKYGVVTTPGISFGNKWDKYIRISVSTELSVLKEFIEIINKLEFVI